ncbi:hypothetical protein ACQKP0_25515 [Heyndrickxia sp. NPDC080065]|uniref:hypothetical protein n=1 Tax=Heyndrickxia sp. NPDC080065 TaxID=3390568 RepID=UPI003D05F97C
MRNKVLGFCKKIKQNGIVKFLFGAFLIFSICIALIYCFNKVSSTIVNIFSWFFTVYILLNYFKVADKYYERRREYRLEKEFNKNIDIKLYQWIGKSDLFEDSLYIWLRESAQKDISSNLKLIKKEIIKTVGESLYDYYLLKNYLEYYAKNNFLYKLWKVITPSAIISAMGILIIKEVFNKFFRNVFFESPKKSIKLGDQIELIVQGGALILIGVLVIIFIRSQLTKDKRILDLIIKVVDTIIKEKEDERANNSSNS